MLVTTVARADSSDRSAFVRPATQEQDDAAAAVTIAGMERTPRTSPSLFVRLGGILAAIGVTELLQGRIPILACLLIALAVGFATAVALHMASMRFGRR